MTDFAPVEYTCPMIDGIIDILKNIKDNNKWIMEEIVKEKPDIDHIVYLLDDANDNLERLIEDDIENVRNANQVLRDWGNSLLNENDEKVKTIDELNDELDEAYKTIEEG